MEAITQQLLRHWLALILLLVAAGIMSWLIVDRGRRGRWSLGMSLAASSLFLLGLGGLEVFEPGGLAVAASGFWLTVLPLAVLAILLAVVFSTGHWSAPLGYVLGVILLFGLGQGIIGALQELLSDGARLLMSLDPLQPLWLLLLLLVPLIIWLSFRSLSGLGPIRKWVAIGLRCLVLTLLVLALAETHARRSDENLTVIFLWDRSLSIPPEFAQGENRDLREERIRAFMNNAVLTRGPGKEDDKVGLIVFGRKPRLELPPASVPLLKFTRFISKIDDTYTDIAAAIKLGLASFPEGTSKRLVLISDGNENLGQAEEQARIAKQNGVQIDVLPIAAGRRNPNEVLVERIEAPPYTEKDTRLPLRIVLRSYHPEIVVGTLKLSKTSLEMRKSPDKGDERPAFDREPLFQKEVRLRQGLNVFYFQQPGVKEEDAYTFEAQFLPSHVEDARGKIVQMGLKGDRVENNQASTSVMARGQRVVLIVESTKPDREGDEPHSHKLLAERLQRARSSLKVVAIDAERLPQDPAQLATILSKFDCVILANVPADALTEEQQKVLRSNTHDQGCGLIMIGGNRGFGAGGWQGTELEKALPVTADLKSIKVEGKSGLVLMMHASEMAEGNAWQRKIAKLAIDRLSPMDMVGMLYYDHGMVAPGGGHIWHIPFQVIADQKRRLMGLVDTMTPGDMPDVDPAFEKAYKQLTNPEYALGTKHIIFISDGDHWNASRATLAKLKAARITCTTVCITTHGQAEVQKMAAIAQFVGGRAYHIKDPSELPAIYIRESRLVSQSFTHEKAFQPRLVFRGGPTEGLGDLENLHGFVRTTKRPSPLVETPIMTPKIGEAEFPILAYWQYGLGKSIAFTSDARTNPGGKAYWDRDWANSNTYSKFWEQTVDWSLRPTESGKYLQIATEQRDGKIRVTIDAKDADKNPLTTVKFKTGITSPSFKSADGSPSDLKFEQKNAGIYEVDIPVDEAGNFFLNVVAEWKDKQGQKMTDAVRAGVTVPYSPEFAEMESNTALLEKIREITGGKTYADEDFSLAQAVRAGDVFRSVPVSHHSMQPLWPWLILLAGILLFFDIAVRRIAVEPAAIWEKASAQWQRIRGREVAAATTVFLERLQSRKAQVSETFDKQKASRRFEAPTGPIHAGLQATAASPAEAPKKPTEVGKIAPEKKAEPDDFAARLMRAKKKAMENRDKDKNR